MPGHAWPFDQSRHRDRLPLSSLTFSYHGLGLLRRTPLPHEDGQLASAKQAPRSSPDQASGPRVRTQNTDVFYTVGRRLPLLLLVVCLWSARLRSVPHTASCSWGRKKNKGYRRRCGPGQLDKGTDTLVCSHVRLLSAAPALLLYLGLEARPRALQGQQSIGEPGWLSTKTTGSDIGY
ncbi:hypothetical protein NDU88_000704 [Pleurodeles waltl]|uniref:Uncharacterized protein n=1 Tax=Pleurodeles waltl TaxID=8319 RepID=A0AAV7S7R6_PLEWA|nr:hypothetical protein NDU88_000704 [Pleurodeles waltl]